MQNFIGKELKSANKQKVIIYLSNILFFLFSLASFFFCKVKTVKNIILQCFWLRSVKKKKKKGWEIGTAVYLVQVI